MATQIDLAFERENEVIPPDVRLVRDFINTVEHQEGIDSWQRPADLVAWFAAHGLLAEPAGADDADLERIKTVREGLREVIAGHAGHIPNGDALARLDDALAATPIRLTFREGDRPVFAAVVGTPVDAALTAVLAAMQRSVGDGTWERLKACDRSTCRWAYYDHSRNRSSRWCTMAGCGNSMKMRRAYANRKARSDS